MLSQSSYLICIYVYSFLFTLSYILPVFKDIFFMVPYSKNSDKAVKEIILYREFFINISILFFIISSILVFLTDNIFYLSCMITLYVLLILFKYYKGNREILRLKLYENDFTVKKPSYFIKLKYYHYSLHFFTILYMLYTIKDFENYYHLNILTSIFLCGFFCILYLFIKNAPDFAEKKVKPILLNYLYLLSYTAVFTLLSFTSSVIFADLNHIIYTVLYLFILIFLNTVYIIYLKKLNKPYEFKIENGKINSKNLIEISLDGTKIFLNFKNKKAYFISAGLALYILIYISLAYLFTI